MLVLTRREAERFFINSNIEIILLSAQSGRARIGIIAPPEVNIRREEVAPLNQPGAERMAAGTEAAPEETTHA